MTAIKLKSVDFSGNSHLSTGRLANAIRGLAQDLAQSKMQNAKITDFTDSSTGTAGTSFPDLVIPTAAFDATSAGGASNADFTTASAALQNGFAVVLEQINKAAARIGMAPFLYASGTVATEGTIPAQTKTVTTSNGTSATDFVTGIAIMKKIKANFRVTATAFNELLVALGRSPLSILLKGDFTADSTLVAHGTPSAAATGASSISKAVMDPFLTGMANGLATISAQWNFLVNQGVLTALTDSSGGTGAAPGIGLAVDAAPAAAAGAATTSAPKAGFDAQLVIYQNACCEIVTRLNALRNFYGLAPYTDSTGDTANATIEALGVSLSAVDGSSGTSAVDVVTATARMATLANNLSSLNAGINDLLTLTGQKAPGADALLGTKSTTIAAIAATGTGVGGATPVTMLNTAVNAWLVIARNNVATLVAQLNSLVGTGSMVEKPLAVVAA